METNGTAFSVLRALITLAVIAGVIGLGVYFFVGDGANDFDPLSGSDVGAPYEKVDGGINPGTSLVPDSPAKVTPPTFPAPTN